jgi:ATP-dependent protease ClpP protease subunit
MPQTQQILKVFGSIGTDVTVERFMAQMALLDRSSRLTVEINSDGGEVQAGVTIFNMLRAWPGGVDTVVVGWALSIASLILMAGENRRASETALIMVHAPWSNATGNADQLRNHADVLDQVTESMLAAYQRSSQTAAIVKSWFDGKDHWMTARDARSYGLITELTKEPAATAMPANASANRHQIPIHLKELFMPQAQAQTTDEEAIRAAAVQSEVQRRKDIAARFSKPIAKGLKGAQELLAKCADDPTVTVQAAGEKLLALYGEGASPVAGHWTGGMTYTSGDDDRISEFKAAAIDVLAKRGGLNVKDPHPAARDLQRMGLAAMAEAMLSMQGRLPLDRSPSSVIHAALTTGDFPDLLSGTANKFLRDGYEHTSSGFVQFTAEREVPDFKAATLVNLSEAPGLLEVTERAEYRHGYMLDSASNFQIATFGRIISISRQMMINDDLGAFTKIPQAFGAAARRLEADKVYAQLTSNPVLNDGVALFHADHNNLASSGGAISVASLGAARAAMRKHKGSLDVGYLDVTPRYLIVPVALETVAEQLLASLVDPSKSNDTGNAEFIRGLTLIADPRLDDDSATAWYLAADPQRIEGILRAYLAGEDRPYLEANTEFKVDAVSHKVRLDFAAGISDYRALYKNPGA